MSYANFIFQSVLTLSNNRIIEEFSVLYKFFKAFCLFLNYIKCELKQRHNYEGLLYSVKMGNVTNQGLKRACWPNLKARVLTIDISQAK